MKHVNAALRGLAWAFSVASILFVGAVWALVRYPDADNTAAYVDSIVVKFLNASGNAVAVSAANPEPVTVTNAASITIGAEYLKDAGGVNLAAVDASGRVAMQLPPNAAQEAGGNLASIATDLTPFTYTNIPTSTSTIIKAAPGVFAGLAINTAGTLSSAVIYDNTTCAGAAKFGTFSTVAQGQVIYPPTAAVTGICVTTADTGGAANITVLWR